MPLREKLKELGFNEKQIIILQKKISYYKINEKRFCTNYPLFEKKVLSYGYDEQDVRNMVIKKPRICNYEDRFDSRYKNFKKVLSGTKNDAVIIAILLILTEDKFNKKMEFLKSLGFQLKDIKTILLKDFSFFTRSSKKIESNFNFYRSLGLDDKSIVKIFTLKVKDIFVKEKEITDNVDKIIEMGFSRNECGTLIKNIFDITTDKYDDFQKSYSLFKSYGLKDVEIRRDFVRYTKISLFNEEVYNDIVNFLLLHGFNDDDIKKVTIKAKEIVCRSNNNLDEIYKEFYKFYFNDDDIKQIILNLPKILYHNSEKIKNILNKLQEYHFNNSEIKYITINYSGVFESGIDSLEQRLKLIGEFDLTEQILDNPKNLIQGPERTFLRYMYVINCIDHEFDMMKIFESRPKGIPDVEELKEIYSYRSYKDNNLFERLKYADEHGIKVKCLH